MPSSPGEDIQSWSPVAADNGTADPLIDWHEGQARASVNNSSRSEMAAHAKNRNLLNGSIVTTGTLNAQAFLSGVGYTTVPTNLLVRLKIGSGLTNDGSATLNMDGLGAVVIKTQDGRDLLGGELVGDCYTDLLYNGTNWVFLYSYQFWWEMMTGGGGIIIGQQIFTSDGTYTPSTGMECCIIECCGGGGGGAGVAALGTGSIVGGGGGSGGYSRKLATPADIGTSQVVTVGAAGTAGATGGGTGGTGGVSSVGTLCVANGGLGGGLGGGRVTGGAGGAPGTGDVAAAGNAGQGGIYTGTGSLGISPAGGVGGASFFGGSATGVAVNAAAGFTGVTARAYGAGGSGGASHVSGAGAAGGVGSTGVVIITEFAGRGAPGRDGEQGPIGPVGPSGPGTGDVLRFGTPTTGQLAQWTDASTIKGVDPVSTSVISQISIQTFTASGTYTAPANLKYCVVECLGGGAGGTGASSGAAISTSRQGGGGGGYSRRVISAATIGASQTVTIGAAGAGGTGNLAGSDGGTTSFGTLCVAEGGKGSGAGGGTTTAVGDIKVGGAPGNPGATWEYAHGAGAVGVGASSMYGGGGYGSGGAATGYGAGGSGGYLNGAGVNVGGAGSAGIVIITQYF